MAKKTHWIVPIAVIMIYTFFMGFRYNVGIDWMQFQRAYIDLVKGTNNVGRDYEPTYAFVNWLFAKVFHLHYSSLFLFQSAIYLTSIYIFSQVSKNQQAAAVTCVLYYCISFFHAINTSRNFMAISIIMFGFYLILTSDKKYWALFLMVVGALCHYATVPLTCVFIILYYYKPKPRFWLLATIYIILFVLLNVQLKWFTGIMYDTMKWLGDLFGDARFDIYMEVDFMSIGSEHHHDLSMLRNYIFVFLNLWFLYYAVKKYKTLTTNSWRIIYWCAIIYVLITNSFQSNELLYRLTYVFEPMFCVVIADFLYSYRIPAVASQTEVRLFRQKEEKEITGYQIYGLLYVVLTLYQFVVDIGVKLTTHGSYFYYKMMDNIERIII